MTLSDLRLLVDNLDEYIHIPGGIERLKKTVLHLAVSGQLVPQIVSAGTGEELHELIAKSTSVKPNNNYTKIDPSKIPFEIPKSWRWVYLENVCDYIQRGKSPKYSPIKKYPVIAQKCNQWSGFSIEKAQFIDPNSISSYRQERFLENYDLLWNSTGLGTLGRVAIYETRLNPYELAVADSHVTVIRANRDLLSPQYAFYWLSSYHVQDVIEGRSGGSTKQKELATSTIREYELPLPPLAEQKRIVAIIDEIFTLIDRLASSLETEETERQVLATTAFSSLAKSHNPLALENLSELIKTKSDAKKLRQAILRLAASGQLVPQDEADGTAEQLYEQMQVERACLISEGKIKKSKSLPEITKDEIPFDIPKTWKWVRLGNLFQIRGGKRLPAGCKLTRTPSKHIYIRVTDMANGSVDTSDLHYVDDIAASKISQYIITNKDLYLSIAGTIGKVGRIPSEFSGSNLTENACRLTPFGELDMGYCQVVISSDFAQSQFQEKKIQMAQPKLALFRIANSIIPLPPLSEQNRIVAKISQIFTIIDKLEKHLEEK